MDIRLMEIKINNFKGIKDLTVKPNGNDLNVFGDNETGKTSLYDALLWCLFNKDSKDAEKFNWKPLDQNNEPIHNLVTEVTAVFSIDGSLRKFSKSRFEKWSTKRGTGKKYFEDVTEYYVDDLKVTTKKVYEEKVAELVDKETFKYLTSVTYFNEVLLPKERREILFKYFGGQSDEELMSSFPEFKDLIPLLENMTTQEAQEKLRQRQKQLGKTINEIPIKISAVQDSMADIESLDEKELISRKQEWLIKKDAVGKEILAIKNGAAMSSKLSDKKTKENEIAMAIREYQSKQIERVEPLKRAKEIAHSALTNVENEIRSASGNKAMLEQSISTYKKRLETINQELVVLEEKFDEKESEVFIAPNFVREEFDQHLLACPTCQRDYEESEKEAIKSAFEKEQNAKEKAHLENVERQKTFFSESKNAYLEAINQDGEEATKEVESLEEKISDLENQLNELDIPALEERRTKFEQEFNEQVEKLEAANQTSGRFEDTDEYPILNNELNQIKQEIMVLENSVNDAAQAEQTKMNQIDVEIQEIDGKLAMITEKARQQNIVESYAEQEKELALEKGLIEEQLILFDQFFIKKVSLLESNVNKHFKHIKFKLFDFYDEGGLNESICEPVVNGVPFRDLNNANRINSGLDVVNTLMKQEGITVPIFVDNAESVTNLLEIDTQVIAMYVSAEDTSLRTETVKEIIEGVA